MTLSQYFSIYGHSEAYYEVMQGERQFELKVEYILSNGNFTLSVDETVIFTDMIGLLEDLEIEPFEFYDKEKAHGARQDPDDSFEESEASRHESEATYCRIKVKGNP